MARGLRSLATCTILLALALAFGGPSPLRAQSSKPLTCSLDGRNVPPAEVAAFRRNVERGLLFQALRDRFGAPGSCHMLADRETKGFDLAYAFGAGRSLTARADPDLEYDSQRALFTGLDDRDGRALLIKAERRMHPSGCGIDWKAPERDASAVPGATEDIVFWGNVCNCQARMSVRGRETLALALSSAC